MHRTPVARARGITKQYGDVLALDGVDLDVEAGRVHGLVGPNGAGKTTLLGLLLGVATADAGSLEILGRPSGRSLAVTPGVTGFVDGPGLYPSLTARQNLTAVAALQGTRPRRGSEIVEALDQVGLGEVADDRVRGFSLGMRQRLGLAAALLARPRLLVLDEPTNGLDPAGTRHVHGLIAGLADDGVAVVLSSHRMEDLALLSSEVTMLATGRVVFSGSLAQLAARSGDLEHLVRTSDPARAHAVAVATTGLRVHGTASGHPTSDALVVSGPPSALDALVVRLVGAGVAVRELTPVVSPLEAAFLALTGGDPEPGDSEDAA
jgi:ABC-2 type transport system ATP-binding protein